MCGPFGKRSLRKEKIGVVGMVVPTVHSLKRINRCCRDGCPNRPFIEKNKYVLQGWLSQPSVRLKRNICADLLEKDPYEKKKYMLQGGLSQPSIHEKNGFYSSLKIKNICADLLEKDPYEKKKYMLQGRLSQPSVHLKRNICCRDGCLNRPFVEKKKSVLQGWLSQPSIR